MNNNPPLGKITSDITAFEKSLNSSSARVSGGFNIPLKDIKLIQDAVKKSEYKK